MIKKKKKKKPLPRTSAPKKKKKPAGKGKPGAKGKPKAKKPAVWLKAKKVAPEVKAALAEPKRTQVVYAPKEKPGAAETLAMLAAETAHDKKAIDVVVLDLRGISPVSDFIVIAGVKSSVQLFALADSIEEAIAMKTGQKPSHREKSRVGEPDWVLLDYFDVMVHVMLNEARGHYQLERLYSQAKVIAEYNDN